MLRLGGSLLQGRVPATGIMRTQRVGDNLTRLAPGVVEFGRIDKTLHALDRGKVGTVLRVVFSGKRGELRQRYR
jgi:hypothetical protein